MVLGCRCYFCNRIWGEWLIFFINFLMIMMLSVSIFIVEILKVKIYRDTEILIKSFVIYRLVFSYKNIAFNYYYIKLILQTFLWILRISAKLIENNGRRGVTSMSTSHALVVREPNALLENDRTLNSTGDPNTGVDVVFMM